MRAVGVVDATCEAIFELVMGMDGTRFEWDCTFQYGSLVEEVDGHTAILYHRLQLDWFPMFIWPRDLCYVRYWRRNDDGSYGLREFFSQTDEIHTVPRIPVMVNVTKSGSSNTDQKSQEIDVQPGPSLDPVLAGSRHSILLDEDSDDDDDYQISEAIPEACAIKTENDVKQIDQIDLSCFSGNLRRDDCDNSCDCWNIPDGKNIKVRSKNFLQDKSKIPAGKYLMELAAVDWLKDTKRMDNVARRVGCVAQL
ncbi:putative protein ENHANCED DISEASE RESISTANCE 2 [Cocos nucifera]|uniref:START domain-containing protein n=1 Tax=Cocos nucifera TaxID=13894 RepID=A0A8K0N6Q8_COCNU|nr:putative protein ENHANCED DISEASE RESISTANCE 2 [Cocos nucifera]